jgi:hypothetical protein
VKRLLILLLLSSGTLRAQVAVAPLQLVRQQFLSATGAPLAGGCVNFFATGTSTPQAIYADSTGTFQLSNPLTLDAAGEASVWMTNTGYDIVANTGVTGQICSAALGTQLWRENNKNPFSIINSGSNFIVASGTVDPGGVAGMFAYRSDIPCLRFFITTWDCIVETNLAQTLTNKTFINPVISSSTGAVLSSPNINGTIVTGPPATYLVMTNDLVTGTVLNKLAKINPAGLAGFAILPLTTDTGGVIGVVTAGAGNTGNATIQQNGSASCVFDNAVTSGDYVQISSTVAGDCHDVGISPANTPPLGRVLATNVAAGTYIVDFFGPAASTGFKFEGSNIVPVTVGNSAATVNLQTITIGANEIGIGQKFTVEANGVIGATGTPGAIICVSVDAQQINCSEPALTATSAQQWSFVASFVCITAGAGGTITPSVAIYNSSTAAGGIVSGLGTFGGPGTNSPITIDTTVSHIVKMTVTWTIANVLNTITSNALTVFRIG